ncbi:MAG: hypothetical protein GC159_17815 [Phycisphaera sp.]|nr:hypothetical protein [Phycisphaera sp.]
MTNHTHSHTANTRRAIATLALAAMGMLTLAVPRHVVAANPQPGTIPAGYSVETIDIPDSIPLEAGGLAFTPKGDLLITTRRGQVWSYRDGNWKLFAEGLAETLGAWVDPKNGDVYVAQRPEVTKLVDEDGDGVADLYLSVNHEWGYDGNYHEYAFGPVRDSKGNFYVTLNLGHTGQGSVQGSIMGRPSPYRGWCVQITPDGKMVPFANGMRSPAGIGITPNDEVFYTDNQGDWNASSTLYHVEKGRFYGHPSSLADDPKFKGQDLQKITPSEYDQLRTMPAVWIPYGELANSPGEPRYDDTKGKFGPFAGQIFIGDQTKSNVMRVWLEKVGGEYQGSIFDFVDHLQCGVIRETFSPDGGSMWVGETQRGWGSVGGKPFGLERIVYDGKTVPFEMHHLALTKDGFDVVFTRPVNADAAKNLDHYELRHWGYLYQAKYGSPKVDEKIFKPSAVSVSDDGLTVHVSIGDPIETRQVYQVTLRDPIVAADGSKPSTRTGYYTVNRLKD